MQRAVKILFTGICVFFCMCMTAAAQITAGDDGPLRFGRFEHQGKVHYGFISFGGVHTLTGSFFDETTVVTGNIIPLEDVKVLPPVVPGKVIGIAQNYKNQGGKDGKLKFFAKLPSSIIGSEDVIVPPPGSSDLRYEGEMVIVMGARTRNVSEKDALSYVFGVTAGNDITEKSFGADGFSVLKAKGADTFAPLGPWISPGLTVDNLKLEVQVNGKTVQKGSTRHMVHSAARIISELSRYITLEAGDVIYTGTPGKTAALKEGDVVDVLLEGIGRLRNTVGAPPK